MRRAERKWWARVFVQAVLFLIVVPLATGYLVGAFTNGHP